MNLDPILLHVESTIGQIDSAWRVTDGNADIRVVRIQDKPCEGVTTLVSLGLSRHVLQMGSREVREELLATVHNRFDGRQVASFLQTLSQAVALKHEALVRGEVIGPGQPIIPNSELSAVYVAVPVLHDERLRTFEGTVPPTVFPWIVPIHANEAQFVREQGWEAFEDLLVDLDADVCDLARDSVVG